MYSNLLIAHMLHVRKAELGIHSFNPTVIPPVGVHKWFMILQLFTDTETTAMIKIWKTGTVILAIHARFNAK